MFGALNRFISRLDSSEYTAPTPYTPSKFPLNASNSNTALNPNAHGFQVLSNTQANLPLEPYFDFIIGINNHPIDSADPHLFSTELRNCAGSTISLGVYCVKGHAIREIYVPIPADGAALGVQLQWMPLNAAAENVWHILDVMPNSPADVAGLLPYGDYVVGSPDRDALYGEAALGELVEEFQDRPLRLYVYNHEYDVLRTLTITPSRTWGGDGALGCVLGYGALHRVPAPLNEPSQAPGETLFESTEDFKVPAATGLTTTEAEQPTFFLPANMDHPSPPPAALATNTSTSATGTSQPPPPSSSKGRKQRAHHNTAAQPAGLDDYFAEGEQKSRELDGGSTPKPAAGAGNLPPPPPKGGPPRATTPAATAEEEEEKEEA
ncbi:GRASP55/65 PDZ-like domain-containing protein [Neohortaea acidophila]|uniref:GRASP55/65 PDZ-like domain-containing protein n=1 Tax=Neohortaea acidophila TaxID=245834 RepID=A0A6A6PKU3_9PEZI|nr:GRASP55/65 PDZ-like domain-containing protein [Neohortaea acidophila]KAF2479887.1 GRASP55/65 PDZ-like domain-containing protein [Neohortaea acidophila]